VRRGAVVARFRSPRARRARGRHVVSLSPIDGRSIDGVDALCREIASASMQSSTSEAVRDASFARARHRVHVRRARDGDASERVDVFDARDARGTATRR
tara:strand:- start:4288 stop:4584 length:297 start_codon:yes stop_codon:yes gene_type:complete